MAFALLLWKVVLLILSSIPLYFSLRLVKSEKKPGLLKVALVNALAGVVVSAIDSVFGLFAGFISFSALLFVYKEMFDLSWFSAFLIWLLQFVVLAAIFSILVLVIGITLVL